jgi:threonine dehydrogenase-like Zn-dependent dehydrogenase
VSRFQPGDEVFGIAAGSFAEYAAAKQDKLAHKPANLTFQQAAVVPISASTALQGLRDAGHVEAGQKVLVVGASGGVGTYAVQIAKILRADRWPAGDSPARPAAHEREPCTLCWRASEDRFRAARTLANGDHGRPLHARELRGRTICRPPDRGPPAAAERRRRRSS